ncbi:ABC(ABCG) family transporter: multidrug [Monoraphidium neglectum]|uniref:ABC(ABCG) family transporter: multidrug n=1 Tax=Monoraphidium neglectum TaxID=145388 RepID=A0A0D2K6K7_9CHLO|nr:ABC(ABCG) family transporter: multidrug [Monoraphidium neglectum]KIY91823.1 ABC(ABCG) family transporter: multidrug [Monoraphidium neglectum]|eukprot:XP_013890843.1 ABC(ABCG) family transporter: multidrug [Monoraphidium neglectum]
MRISASVAACEFQIWGSKRRRVPHDTALRVEQLERQQREAAASGLAVRNATNTPWWWGLLVLVKYRTFYNYTDTAFLGARLADKVSMGITIMSLYWGIGGRLALDNIFNIAAVLFMWCMIPAFGAAAFVPSLVLERRLFVRERHDGLYRVSTYLAAKMIDEIGVAALGSVVISAIVYYGVRLEGAFTVFWITYFATLCVGICEDVYQNTLRNMYSQKNRFAIAAEP